MKIKGLAKKTRRGYAFLSFDEKHSYFLNDRYQIYRKAPARQIKRIFNLEFEKIENRIIDDEFFKIDINNKKSQGVHYLEIERIVNKINLIKT